MDALNLKWSFGNSKMKKLDILAFGIPAYQAADGFKTCPQAGACAAICYARQGFYVMPNVRAAREHNLALTRSPEFVGLAIADLARLPNRIIRIHDSGDFYSQEYLDKWAQIARNVPGKRFYAYTKSIHLDFQLPPNFSIIQSEGGKLDARIDRTLPHSRIFATHTDRKRAGYANGYETDWHAIHGTKKIGLVYHGRPLTDAQKKHFS